MSDLSNHARPDQALSPIHAKDNENNSREGKHIAGVLVTIKQEPEGEPRAPEKLKAIYLILLTMYHQYLPNP